MEQEQLKKLISSLEFEDNNKEAYLGIFYQHEDTFIKANKKGILKLANSLLKSLKDFDFHLSKEDHFSIIKLDKGDWYDKEGIIIDCIEPTNETRNEININYKKENSTKWYHGIISFLFSLFLFFLIISFFIGLFTSLKWFYNLIF
ncbi:MULTISPECIES: hypothetical protein [unclassified Tenacibaculum]|uniref:hypothetical protein n=1 Tax=unclassified Tenacibaculum TaxID=2635139 RepID=UPI001F15E1D7|nr:MULTISPECIES: hypothetical protein [unclassified Tenacibaculum]MCF2874718.1 hypothetical protein [Tenacibaculum sp. Cn5-1]MCF2934216.1 hypothetical protein [Tenacibaculum sp. Cn5-34]MCG7510426.1 hypothetical protein [Tenacibaculum sp. Cn5-46]